LIDGRWCSKNLLWLLVKRKTTFSLIPVMPQFWSWRMLAM
jgi:hypothetical protein